MRLVRWVFATTLRRVIAALVVVVLVPIAAFAWWLASPLLFDTVVYEPFPLSAGAVLPADVTQEEAEKIMAEEAAVEVVVDEPMKEMAGDSASLPAAEPEPDQGGQIPSPTPQPTETPDASPPSDPETDPGTSLGSDPGAEDPTPTSAPDPESPASTPTPTPAPMPTPTATTAPMPVALQTGSLRDADSFHKGSGNATIYELPDGSRFLRLEEIDVTNGPDLHVLLSAHPNPDSRNEVKDLGYVDLGKLKGNIGNQNYEIPAELDVAAYSSVVIYCQPFHVIFSVAPLVPANE